MGYRLVLMAWSASSRELLFLAPKILPSRPGPISNCSSSSCWVTVRSRYRISRSRFRSLPIHPLLPAWARAWVVRSGTSSSYSSFSSIQERMKDALAILPLCPSSISCMALFRGTVKGWSFAPKKIIAFRYSTASKLFGPSNTRASSSPYCSSTSRRIALG